LKRSDLAISTYLIGIALFFSCSNKTSITRETNSQSILTPEQYDEGRTFFVGIGTSSSSNEEMAIKIARSRALGDLSDNIKVSILSMFEMTSTETGVGSNYALEENFREQIITIGNATVRSPEFITHEVRKGTDNKIYAVIVARKLKEEHIRESARDIELQDAAELIINTIRKND
jgi:hypothetical protein|tara:strand:+ start:1089 stop:1613 length:525 start_codon:yes stop_codon:yes gene_type:complete